MENSSIFFVPLVEKEGKLDYNVESVIREIHGYDFSQMKGVSFEYFNSSLSKVCEETVNFAYEEMG